MPAISQRMRAASIHGQDSTLSESGLLLSPGPSTFSVSCCFTDMRPSQTDVGVSWLSQTLAPQRRPRRLCDRRLPLICCDLRPLQVIALLSVVPPYSASQRLRSSSAHPQNDGRGWVVCCARSKGKQRVRNEGLTSQSSTHQTLTGGPLQTVRHYCVHTRRPSSPLPPLDNARSFPKVS
jgi:hypothetical protein